ncbi:MAG: autotransporter strand-loop-strand O-heptosyltransferase [Desulfovibrio sp.]|jgi:autotransporter strand-loop-strand O-heptosyltransferase|nr:autotransporter strand-loop-strand O-heptosyltransferase [Desulfovibrio sp.]
MPPKRNETSEPAKDSASSVETPVSAASAATSVEVGSAPQPASGPGSSAAPGGLDDPAAFASQGATGQTAPASPDPAQAAGVGVRQDPFFIPPPDIPTQEGPKGVRYDFNDGARIWLPPGKWHAEIHDAESGNVIFACDANEGWVVSTKKYYIPFVIKVWEQGNPSPLVDHALNMQGKHVLIKFPVGTLGDLVGWFPYADKFQRKHDCQLECALADNLIEIFKDQYPNMTLNTPQTVVTKYPYASYRVGLFFRGNRDAQPIDFRQVGLHRTAGYILGVDPTEEPPKVNLDIPRRIEEPYVCIATKSSCQAKFWNNGHGWTIVVKHLREMGYRVLAIDKDAITGMGHIWNHVPHDAEDFTGNLPLGERIALIRHADFFIGLSSGLSWLAWCCKVPIVLISGFTLPICEFVTPYRVYSSHGCTGCWDATDCNFDHHDFLWCPRHKGTDRQFECSRLITGQQVIGHITRLMKDYNLKPPKDR